MFDLTPPWGYPYAPVLLEKQGIGRYYQLCKSCSYFSYLALAKGILLFLMIFHAGDVAKWVKHGKLDFLRNHDFQLNHEMFGV